jgi:hypothetical protein
LSVSLNIVPFVRAYIQAKGHRVFLQDSGLECGLRWIGMIDFDYLHFFYFERAYIQATESFYKIQVWNVDEMVGND